MFDPKKYVVSAPKPLPVILLLDVSGSMSGEKITSLNNAVKTMIDSFKDISQTEIEIMLAVITFGSSVDLHLPYTKVSEVEWTDLKSGGLTPLGTALEMACDMIEDKETTPSRAYRPVVILVSDGQPTDSWEENLTRFIKGLRTGKCDRMAMGIGEDADMNILKKFLEHTEHKVFVASEANEIQKFFNYVTMSVVTRTLSKDPNKIPTKEEIKENSKNISEYNDPDELAFY